MAPHLVQAQSAYKDIWIHLFQHIHTHIYALSLSLHEFNAQSHSKLGRNKQSAHPKNSIDQ